VATVHKEVDVITLRSRLARVLVEEGLREESLLELFRALKIVRERSIRYETSTLFADTDRIRWRSNNATEMDLLHQTSELLSSMGKHEESLEVSLRQWLMALEASSNVFGHKVVGGGEVAPAAAKERSMVDVGNAHLHGGDVREAKGWYERVVSLNPKSMTGLNNYATACYRLGDYETSLLTFRTMLKMNGRDKRAMEGLKALANFATRYDRRSSSSWNLFGALHGDL
jgi:tetratricopeptide (TPR) repeat protein